MASPHNHQQQQSTNKTAVNCDKIGINWLADTEDKTNKKNEKQKTKEKHNKNINRCSPHCAIADNTQTMQTH